MSNRSIGRGWRRRLWSVGLGVVTPLALAGSLEAQNRQGPLPDQWQLRLERLQVIIPQENSLFSNGDEPYLAVIGFKSTFGEAGSTRIIWNSTLREIASGMDRGDVADIPPEMGFIDFGVTDGDYANITLLGALVVALESDATSFGIMEDLFDEVADSIKDLLVTEFESGNPTLLDPETRSAAIRDLRCSMNLSTGRKIGIWLSSAGDPDDVIAMQSLIYLAGAGPGDEDPVLTRSRPWETGVSNVAEQTFDLNLNAIRFDARVPPGTPPSLNCDGEEEEPEGESVFYEVGGRMTSNILRGGWLNRPEGGSVHWDTVEFEYERCGGCHPATEVFFMARYDAGDGQNLTGRRIGTGVPDPQNPRKFRFTWDISGLPPQTAQVWAGLVSDRFAPGVGVLTREYTVELNRDSRPPTGVITAPATGSYHGTTIAFDADVTDTQSGVDRVEYWLTAADGTRFDVPSNGTTENGFAVVWNSSSVTEGPATVCATAVDQQGNRADLPCVSDVRIDHTPPVVASIYPSPDGQSPTWIRSGTSTMLRASAQDAGAGVREVVFSAWYTDTAGVYGAHPIGRGQRLQNGEYQISWTVSGIPDQADRGQHRLFVDVSAVDNAGNSTFATGWLAGLDRVLPTVGITSPISGLTVSGGSVAIAATAGDNLGIGGGVEQLVVTARYREPNAPSATDHVLVTLSRVTGWSGSLNVAPLPEQVLSITATATDTAGNSNFLSRTVTIDRTAPSFSGVGHSAQPFLAGGGRTMSFTYQVSERSAVTITIRDASGQAVRALRFPDVTTAPQVALWDGTDARGAFVTGGAYTYTLDAVDRAGNSGTHPGGSLTVIVDTTPPQVSVASAPNPYSLAGPVLDIRYQQNEPARTEVEILDGASVIRYLGALQSTAGIYRRTWDGLHAQGQRVTAPRVYTIRVRAVDAAGNTTVVTAPVSVVP
jgi:hypothetical protein